MCEYDSTWDTESDGDDPAESQTRRSSQDKTKSWTGLWSNTSSRNMRAAKDMQNYRRGYPNLSDEECSEDRMINLKFYLNEYRSSPDDVLIESFLKDWKTDYKRLERVHSYIQWLFPLREPGVNYLASELTKKEIQAFRESDQAKKRLVESYELMLGFYGIRLVNQETGEVGRADNWRERFSNLDRNIHNNLRITRILKSLGELGFEHYQAPLVRFFLEETLVKKTLSSVKRSVLDYFLFAVRDKRKRKELVRFAYQHYEPKDKFVWCPRKIQKQLKKAEKRPEAAGTRDGVDEGRSRLKGKDGEAGASPKDDKDMIEDAPETQKGTDGAANEDADKLFEGSSVDPKPEAESDLGDSNGHVEMDHSGSPDPDSGNGESDVEGGVKDGSNTKDRVQEQPALETMRESESEKPPKKKREGDVDMPSNGLKGDLTNGQQEVTAAPSNSQTSPSETVPSTGAKTEGSLKDSPSCSLERGEKIPRTDFSPASDANEGSTSLPPVSAACRDSAEKAGGEQANGREQEEMDVESTTPSLDQDMGHS